MPQVAQLSNASLSSSSPSQPAAIHFDAAESSSFGAVTSLCEGMNWNLVPAVDLHAGHGLEDRQHPVEDDVRRLLGIEQRLVGVAPSLAGAEGVAR
jgi:hypothetical protein